jgi:hypothetical protein
MKFEHLHQAFRLQSNPIREAEEAIVRELAAIQRVKDHLNALLRQCLLRSELIVSEVGEWLLENFVHSLKALMGVLTSMTDMALARIAKISHAELALLNATTREEREKVLNAVHQLSERSKECRIILLHKIIRVASDLLMRFRQTLP